LAVYHHIPGQVDLFALALAKQPLDLVPPRPQLRCRGFLHHRHEANPIVIGRKGDDLRPRAWAVPGAQSRPHAPSGLTPRPPRPPAARGPARSATSPSPGSLRVKERAAESVPSPWMRERGSNWEG